MNTPKLRMASISHLFLVSAWVFKPTKIGRRVSCLFCVSEVMTPLVTVQWKAIDCEINSAALFYDNWFLIALSHTLQSV